MNSGKYKVRAILLPDSDGFRLSLGPVLKSARSDALASTADSNDPMTNYHTKQPDLTTQASLTL